MNLLKRLFSTFRVSAQTEVARTARARIASRELLAAKEVAKESWASLMPVFLVEAMAGAASCELPIKVLPEVADSLARSLVDAGVSSTAISELLSYGLIAVCPRCNQWCSGNALLTLKIMAMAGKNAVFTGNSGGGERLIQGRCLNCSCENSTFELFWCPDLDPRMLDNLWARGINIDPQAQKRRDCFWKPKR